MTRVAWSLPPQANLDVVGERFLSPGRAKLLRWGAWPFGEQAQVVVAVSVDQYMRVPGQDEDSLQILTAIDVAAIDIAQHAVVFQVSAADEHIERKPWYDESAFRRLEGYRGVIEAMDKLLPELRDAEIPYGWRRPTVAVAVEK